MMDKQYLVRTVETYVDMVSMQIPEDTQMTELDVLNWFSQMRDDNKLNDDDQRVALDLFRSRLAERGLLPESNSLEDSTNESIA